MMGADRGTITAEYFDTGVSRRLPWNARQQASRLLKALAQPNRPFDAIVLGEFERAFYADQYTLLAPVFAAHGVQVWLPELDGPVDPASEAHLSLAGAARRTLAPRGAASPIPGRGRDARAGPDPRPAPRRPPAVRLRARRRRAASEQGARQVGRRLLRLDPDPATAPTVRWIFEQRPAGSSVTAIARDLNTR